MREALAIRRWNWTSSSTDLLERESGAIRQKLGRKGERPDEGAAARPPPHLEHSGTAKALDRLAHDEPAHPEAPTHAYGAGILSSYGEIEEFRHMDIRPLDIPDMAARDYDITHYQPVLYAAESLTQLVEVVGRRFADFDHDTPDRLGAKPRAAA